MEGAFSPHYSLFLSQMPDGVLQPRHGNSSESYTPFKRRVPPLQQRPRGTSTKTWTDTDLSL